MIIKEEKLTLSFYDNFRLNGLLLFTFHGKKSGLSCSIRIQRGISERDGKPPITRGNQAENKKGHYFFELGLLVTKSE